MFYSPGNKEDEETHKKFHKKKTLLLFTMVIKMKP